MTIDRRGPLNTGAATGSDGSATSSATSDKIIRGRVLAAYIEYQHSPPSGTTDITIATQGTIWMPAITILTVSNSATDGIYYPRHQVHGNTGTALTMDGTRPLVEPVPIFDRVTVTIAGANALDNADIYLLVES